MKKFIGIALLVFAVCVNVNAQSKVDRVEMEAKKLAKELNLTEEQLTKKAEIDASTMEQFKEINVLRQQVMEERKAMPQDATPEQREAVNEKMKALRETQMKAKKLSNERFMEILSEEQIAKYKEFKTVKKAPSVARPSGK